MDSAIDPGGDVLMGAASFDALLRTLASGTSRRNVLHHLAQALLALSPLALASEPGLARKRRKSKSKRKKRRRKRQPSPLAPPPPTSRPCISRCGDKRCGDDGCGGSCGLCNGGTCQAGICVCSGGQQLCQGRCVAPCASMQALDPLTCTCCRVHTASPCDTGPLCCSGICVPSTGGGGAYCDGRNFGAACDFDAQCRNAVCQGGVCTCPEGSDLCAGICQPECAGPNVKIPGTCSCCRRNDEPCSEFTPCCSGLCYPMVGCQGIPAEDPCEFDEQCFSGSCTLGFCD